MSLTKSNVFCNVHGVTFVATIAGSVTTFAIPEVEDAEVGIHGTPVMWGADAAPGPTAKKVVGQERKVKLIGADRATIAGIPQGILGTLTWIEDDFKNGALTGSVTNTLINCSLDDHDTAGKHNEVRKITATFSAVWTLTSGLYVDPYTFVQAS